MGVSQAFRANYREAREHFLETARAAGAQHVEYRHPFRGPSGETLATDVAWVGPTGARRVLVTMSGTHGVEGLAGSGIQTAALAGDPYRGLPQDTAVVLIHALNPWGFAWERRTNEQGIDVCRNFVDFRVPLPHNSAFDEFARDLVPEQWEGESRERADQNLGAYIGKAGIDQFREDLATGQFHHWFAPFFGGWAPSWSNRTLRHILREQLANVREIVLLDYHTGLGERGAGQILGFHEPGEVGDELGRACFGERFVSLFGGESIAYPTIGDIAVPVREELGRARCLAGAYEFGTVTAPEVFQALRGDHWLHTYGSFDSPFAGPIKQDIRRAFYCDDDAWRESIFGLAVAAETDALEMLARS